ncbi:MAG: hypothetical protein AAF449_08250 [Myxococcota bacterium]
MEDLSAESVLASFSPVDLFGAEALQSSSALKRAYARLIRRYGPDHHPQVFAHIRDLYEQARDGVGVQWVTEVQDEAALAEGAHTLTAERAASSSDIMDPADPEADHCRVPVLAFEPIVEPSSEVSPAVELSDSLNEENWDRVEKLLTDEAGYLLSHSPELWLDAALSVAEARVFQTSSVSLQRRLKILDSIGFVDDLTSVQRLEELLLLGLGAAEARADEDVPTPLLDALGQAYFADDVRCAELWLKLNGTLDDEALVPAIERLTIRYPEVFRAFNQVNARVSQSEIKHHEWLEGGRLGRRLSLKDGQLRRVLQDSGPWWLFKSFQIIFLGIPLFLLTIVLAVALTGVGTFIGAVMLFAVMGATDRAVRRYLIRRPSAWRAPLRRRTIDVMQAQVLWPHEVVAAAMVRVGDLDRYIPAKTLIDLEQDRSLVVAAMTPAHVERVRARNEEESA